MSMNFTLSGNLAKDPVFDSFGTDGVRARIRVGSDRWTSDDDGNRTTVAEFHDITLFGRVAEKLRDASTGDSVRLTGDVRPAKWTKDGNTVYGHNFVARSVDWQTKEDARAAREQAKQATGEQNATEITVPRIATPLPTVGSGEYLSQAHANAAMAR